MGIITPTSLSFMDEHGYEIPDIDPRQHTLTIQGMVDRPMTFTMEDLLRLPSVSRIHTVECNSNGTVNHEGRLQSWATPGDIFGELSCNEYTGVLLSTLLGMAGVQRGASWLWAGAQDSTNHTKSIPLFKAMDDTIVAYGQNGEPLRPEQGFPLRLLTPGWEGVTNIKRLARIKVTNEPGPLPPGSPHLHHDEGGRQNPLVPIYDATQIGHPPTFWQPADTRQGILRDPRYCLVWSRQSPQGRNHHRWRPDLEGRAASGAGVSEGDCPVCLSLDLERRRTDACLPLHG